MSYKGVFKPRNPSKYKGDPTKIIYRSSWELRLMSYLDSHPDVVEWASEEFSIPYRSPIDGRLHRYFPDFYVKKKAKTGFDVVIIEVKPSSQTIQPATKSKSKITKSYVNEVYRWGINDAKWKAAHEYCKKKNWKFQIMTEKELGING